MIFVNMVSQPGSCFWGHQGRSLCLPGQSGDRGYMRVDVFGHQAPRLTADTAPGGGAITTIVANILKNQWKVFENH